MVFKLLPIFFWMLVGVGLLVAPTIIGAFYGITLVDKFEVTVGIYGGITLFRYILQFVFSLLNRLRVNKFGSQRVNSSIALNITGWREDPILFENCLKSSLRLLTGERSGAGGTERSGAGGTGGIKKSNRLY